MIEVETRYKSEINRIKKKYESDIRELEGALDNANRANAEYLKQIKILQLRVKVTKHLRTGLALYVNVHLRTGLALLANMTMLTCVPA